MRKIWINSLLMVMLLADISCSSKLTSNGTSLSLISKGFLNPPDSAKPGVYWYFMDGNMSRESMTKDLESMKKAGIGNLIFLEVNVGVPRGGIDFLSDQWAELFAHAEKEARRLGIEITLGIGPGWTGSGGPWVKGKQSMQHLVASETKVSAGVNQRIVLPVPPPKLPFFGEGGLTAEVHAEWLRYYEDVAVLAFPLKKDRQEIKDLGEKALYYRAPYSSGTVKPDLGWPSNGSKEHTNAIQKDEIIDLTGRMQADGTLNWSPPAGDWVIMRFVSRNNGAITRPAPFPGLGLEADKFDTTAINGHLDAYLGKIFKKIDKIKDTESGGLKRLHMDSWEMGAQNWTTAFQKEFIKRRGYDPLKYYPVYAGNIVGSLAESERFLWDLRQTSQELVLENHAQHVKNYARRHHLSLSIEPYDMNPTSDLELGAVADVPMAEFWSKGYGFNSTYSVIEATSIAHVMGRSLVPAEAFTAQNNEGWKQHPGSMKNQGDWAFAAGINRFVYHTFQNQFLPDSLRPGVTMGPYGVHWDRGQTWWPMVDGYHSYVSRSQYLLQQGRTVADILYLTPEGSPHVFVPPFSAIVGDTIGDRKGYNFDGCTPGQLMKAKVLNNEVVFPSGAAYRMLVLPIYESMRPELLDKIGSLISEGAMVVGNPPLRSPSLSDYPFCDDKVTALAKLIWGEGPLSGSLIKRNYGKGLIISGAAITDRQDQLYPQYDLTADLLRSNGLAEDFRSDGDKLRYTHRMAEDWDIYFVSNRTDKLVKTNAQFRTIKGSPELWNPITGKMKAIADFEAVGGVISLPMELDAYESVFVVFAKQNQWKPSLQKSAARTNVLQTLSGIWEMKFDPKWGGPAAVLKDTLSDWIKHKDEGVRYYSGSVIYHKKFDLRENLSGELYLDLGVIKNMARVTLNGKDLGVVWTAPWRVDISNAVKLKENELKIEVVNLWANRLIGDEKKPYDGIENDKWPEWLLKGKPRSSGRYTFTTSRQYSKDSPLLSSGLIGPVTIVKAITE